MHNEPLVSVCCITYNHEKYIREAIEGFLMQETSFPIEILIHDDASTDKTADIIREYEAKYPNIIKPIYQTENQYSKGVGISATYQWPRAKGKYIALCEGDDYWTDPLKLQKQVDFLEANPEYGMVCTDIYLIDDEDKALADNKMVLRQREYRKPVIDFFDLLQCNIVNTLSTCIRADLMKELAERVVKENLWFVHDSWFWLNIGMVSKIRVFYDKTAAYRVHANGISKKTGYLSSRRPHILYSVISRYLAIGAKPDNKEQEDILFKNIRHLFTSNMNFKKKRIMFLILIKKAIAFRFAFYLFRKLLDKGMNFEKQ
jgi:glycosyltransferase involved in cell wall biosynthesis